ncbi:MAG TPA: hypothetical protein VGW38_02135 [Chloroflexota bacterium]|nr:hypothetical protein [Chloroflexota bacterium]
MDEQAIALWIGDAPGPAHVCLFRSPQHHHSSLAQFSKRGARIVYGQSNRSPALVSRLWVITILRTRDGEGGTTNVELSVHGLRIVAD